LVRRTLARRDRAVTNPNGAKGAEFERQVRDRFRYAGHRYAERSYGAGRSDDVGDLSGILGGRIVIQCKNTGKIDLSGALDDAEVQRLNARADYAAVVQKRRGKNASRAYVIMDLDSFARLLKEIELA
jgi:Holliday junction resolvase